MSENNTTKMFIFTKNFANNWVAGQEVICEVRDNGKVLVDAVAEVDAEELMKHGHFETKQTQIEGEKAVLKSQATELWQKLCEAELPYEDFVEVQEFIINLFHDIN